MHYSFTDWSESSYDNPSTRAASTGVRWYCEISGGVAKFHNSRLSWGAEGEGLFSFRGRGSWVCSLWRLEEVNGDEGAANPVDGRWRAAETEGKQVFKER